MDKIILSAIEEKIGYTFKNKDLLEQAFIRRSWSEEEDFRANNEILEFIGDKALDMIIMKRLVERYVEKCKLPVVRKNESGDYDITRVVNMLCPGEYDEGRLTKIKANLVCSKSLSAAIDELDVAKYLKTSNGDLKTGVINEPHVKEDLFEAIIGAVSVDSGWNMTETEKAVNLMLNPDKKLDNGLNDEDYIGLVQSWYQKRNGGALPEYVITETENGFNAKINIYPELSKEFIYFCNMEVEFTGIGRSKDAARSEAARKAWQNISREHSSRKSFKELVGEPDKNRAINQLQELWQKGYIEKPEYIFTKKSDEDSGQDVWLCECKIGDFPCLGVYETSKIEAKKTVAYDTTLELSRQFIDYSKKEII